MTEFGHGTHVGLRRDHNEDTYSAEPAVGLWLVADGMGGHEQGEVASAIARDTVVERVRSGNSLDEAIRGAAAQIIEYSEQRDDESSSLPMGTTLAAVVIGDTEYEVAWVGDSRIYQWDGKTLEQLTTDHSYVQELVDQGAISAEQARHHPHRNVVTQALGVTDPDALQVDSLRGKLAPGGQILLCSDGLTEEVDDPQISAILSEAYSPQESVDHLILAALENGGSDNITVLLVAPAS